MGQFAANELGTRRMNIDATPGNNFPLTTDLCECDTAGLAACQDNISGAAASPRTIVAVWVDGVRYALDAAVSAISASAVRTALEAFYTRFETKVYIEVAWATNVLTVRHIGQTTLTKLELDNGAFLTSTRDCTTAVQCDFTISAVGALATLGDGATTGALDGPYAYTGVGATDAATAAALQADIIAASAGLAFDATGLTTVTVNNVTQKFDVKIHLASTYTPYLNGVAMLRSNCVVEF